MFAEVLLQQLSFDFDSFLYPGVQENTSRNAAAASAAYIRLHEFTVFPKLWSGLGRINFNSWIWKDSLPVERLFSIFVQKLGPQMYLSTYDNDLSNSSGFNLKLMPDLNPSSI